MDIVQQGMWGGVRGCWVVHLWLWGSGRNGMMSGYLATQRWCREGPGERAPQSPSTPAARWRGETQEMERNRKKGEKGLGALGGGGNRCQLTPLRLGFTTSRILFLPRPSSGWVCGGSGCRGSWWCGPLHSVYLNSQYLFQYSWIANCFSVFTLLEWIVVTPFYLLLLSCKQFTNCFQITKSAWRNTLYFNICISSYVGKGDGITISVWNRRKIHKKSGSGFLGCVRLVASAIHRLKDTGCESWTLVGHRSFRQESTSRLPGGFCHSCSLNVYCVYFILFFYGR